MVNYFEVLNVSENAELEVIKSAYKVLSKKYHPDNTKLPEAIAKEKMTLINEAYEILSDEVARKEYIIKLHAEKERTKAKVQEECNNYEMNEKWDFENKAYYVVIFIVIASIICCGFYYGPNIIHDIVINFANGLKAIVNTY